MNEWEKFKRNAKHNKNYLTMHFDVLQARLASKTYKHYSPWNMFNFPILKWNRIVCGTVLAAEFYAKLS